MERTESFIIEVVPSYENAKIKQMEMFGWNLQGRQEIMGHLMEAKTSDSLFVAMWRGGMEGATGKKYYEYDHYVKLHFARSLNLPNLVEIKKLEAEYRNLPYPKIPSLKGPIIFILFWLIGLVPNVQAPPGAPIIVTIFIAIGGAWFYSRMNKRKVSMETRQQSEHRGKEIETQLS